MSRQLVYKLHLWLSLPLGVIITLTCLSGAILVFKTEIRDALGMPAVLPQHNIARQADGHNAATGHNAASFAHGSTTTDGHSHAAARSHGHAASKEHSHTTAKSHGHATGDTRHGTTTKRDFFSYVTRFHTSFYLGTTGRAVVTYATLLFTLILVSGLWIWWPRNRRQWAAHLKVATKKGARRLVYDLHANLGFYVTLWLLMLALTGAAFGLHLLPRGSEAIRIAHEIHVGKWGGMVTKVITFAVSLIGASLPITGYWLYFKKRRTKRRHA